MNKLRAVLHTVFSRAIKAQLWTGANPVAAVETRRVPRRAYATLRAEEVPVLLPHVPEDWRGVFAAALYTGMAVAALPSDVGDCAPRAREARSEPALERELVTRLLPELTEGGKSKGRSSGFPLERPALQMEREKGFELIPGGSANMATGHANRPEPTEPKRFPARLDSAGVLIRPHASSCSMEAAWRRTTHGARPLRACG